MTVSISAVVLLGAIVIWLVRKGGLKPAHAIVSVLLGFYLAGSSLAPSITELTKNVAETISQLRL